MELEELQKIWNDQKGEHMYAINENAMHQSISRKKDAAQRKINKAELAVMLINSVVAVILFVDGMRELQKWDFFYSGILAFTVVFILINRRKRLEAEKVFDRTMIGELEHAIANTQAIIRFNFLMLVGYLLPMSVFVAVKFIEQGASLEKWLLIIGLHIMALVLLQYERRRHLLPRKHKLEQLKKKLEHDNGF